MEKRNSNASNQGSSSRFWVLVFVLATAGGLLWFSGPLRAQTNGLLGWIRSLASKPSPNAASPKAPTNRAVLPAPAAADARSVPPHTSPNARPSHPSPSPVAWTTTSPAPLPTSPASTLPPRKALPPQADGIPRTGDSDVTVVTTDPNQLVLAAVRQSVWGPSVACKVQQTSKAHGQQVVLLGDFKSEAVGTGRFRRFRLGVRLAVGETSFDLIQVSDGRMMWTQVGSDSPPRRVILDQVLQGIPNALQYSDARPEVHLMMAIGGQAELLRALYHRYNWYRAVGGKLAGADVWQLVGRLRTEPTRIAGNTPLDDSNSVLGDNHPNLPTEARLTLSRSAKLPYFPYMIEYFDRGRDRNGQPDGFELVTRIEYTEPKSNVTFQDQDFQYRVSDTIDEIKDETQIYLPQSPITGLGILPTQ